MAIPFLVIMSIVLLVGGLVLLAFNRLVALEERCHQAFADVDVQLKQRHDLIPQLAETVRAFAGHEKAAVDQVVALHREAIEAVDVEVKHAAETQLGSSLSRLFVIAQGYPDLQASPHFMRLSEEISDTENKIAAARRFLNRAVAEHNAVLGQFPTRLYAARTRFRPKKRFDLGLDRPFLDDAPKLKL